MPGRISSIVNIHNPSIEVHPVDRSLNTGAAVILVAGGGHNTLNVGTEGADFVPYFFNYGVNTIILRNRLRKDGYKAEVLYRRAGNAAKEGDRARAIDLYTQVVRNHTYSGWASSRTPNRRSRWCQIQDLRRLPLVGPPSSSYGVAGRRFHIRRPNINPSTGWWRVTGLSSRGTKPRPQPRVLPIRTC